MSTPSNADRSSAPVVLDGRSLALADVERIACGAPLELAAGWRERVARSRALVEEAVRCADGPDKELVYGVTTGFGSLKDRPVREPERAARMQRNLLLSHAAGTGAPFSAGIVRVSLALRLNAFLRGRSGVRTELVEFLLELARRGVVPRIPEQGSLGASGDLAPLAHLGIAMLGEGYSRLETRRFAALDEALAPVPESEWRPAREVLAEVGLGTLELSFKEGLAITNGTTVTTALAATAWCRARRVLQHADLCGAMTLEACTGRSRAFDPKIHAERGQPGQERSARNVLALCEGSTLLDRTNELQDSYSLRCMPQVHGASQDALEHAGRVLARELNAATDNPLFFCEDGDEAPVDVRAGRNHERLHAYSGGNFHAQPVALVADYLKLAVAELGSIAERRIQKLLDPHHNAGLPPYLIAKEPGMNSGLMIAQYTAAALVSENKVLAHPASADSIPTSANIEDHVSMGPIAARHLHRVIDHVERVLAIEALVAAQALDFRTGALPCDAAPALVQGQPGRGVAALLATVRDASRGGVPAMVEDRVLSTDIEAVRQLLVRDRLRAAALRAGAPDPQVLPREAPFAAAERPR
ncbi:MAG: histidine ammonia-lyase [Planctomycetes bacterium]|nr:histidine ammonia-lyase [Planctomycetota bacterium]